MITFVYSLILISHNPSLETQELLGQKAPELKVVWVDSAPETTSRARVLVFWATWCSACKRRFASLERDQTRYAKEGVEFVGISIDKASTRDVEEFVRESEFPIPFRVAHDSASETWQAYGGSERMVGIPYAFVIDSEERVTWHGPLDESLFSNLDLALEGTVNIDEARSEIRARTSHDEIERQIRQERTRYLDLASRPGRQAEASHLGFLHYDRYRNNVGAMCYLAYEISRNPDIIDRDRELALAAAEAAHASSGENTPSVMNILGLALFEAGRKEQAIALLERALRIAQADSASHQFDIPRLEDRLSEFRSRLGMTNNEDRQAKSREFAEIWAERLASLSRGEGNVEDLVADFVPEGVAGQGRDVWTEFLSDLVRRHGECEVEEILITADQRFEIWLRCRLHQEFVVADVRVEGQRIDDLSFRREDIEGLPDGMDSGMTSTEIATVLDGWLSSLSTTGRFSGSVLFLEEEGVLLREGYGLANESHAVPCRPETRFCIGSINKTFTAMIVSQLLNEGSLDLDDEIGLVLESLGEAPWRAVTIRQLLTHTGGTGDYLDSVDAADLAVAGSIQELVELVRETEISPVGSFRYSNTGYLILGAAIEAATGDSYYDVVQKRVFGPLGMTGAGHTSGDRVVANLATGYFKGSDGRLRSNMRRLFERTPQDAAFGGPAGGGYATVDDLGCLARALLKEDVDSAARRLIQSLGSESAPTQSPSERYGFGLTSVRTEGVHSFGHTGGFVGINALFEVFPDQRLGLILLANREGVVDLVAPRVREMVARMDIP